jgi:hypothetical protein
MSTSPERTESAPVLAAVALRRGDAGGLPRPFVQFLSFILAMVLAWPGVAHASPGEAMPEPDPVDAEAAAATEPAVTPGEDADADPVSALEEARAATEADPSAANWHAQGVLLEQLGDYEGAAAAYSAEIDALGETADAERTAARRDLQRVRDKARGRVDDEPASTHRAELDQQWAPTKAKPAKSKVAPCPEPEPEPRDRIVRKWYFWVTVVAIVASAAAVTGIAIKASRDERRDALDLRRDHGIQGPALFRF